MVLVETKDYRFYYPEQDKYAISIDEWKIEKGTFCLLVGDSGCGKTTLLRQLAGNNDWQGREEGVLTIHTDKTGYVWQNPDNQIVTDRVEHEIVFGLENEGMTVEQMRRKLAEIVAIFGLEDLLAKDTMALSGGEKQMLNIASALVMDTELLLLDEPTSQLDPVSATRLYDMLRHINEEYGITIVMAEQRLEEAVTYADTMLLLSGGNIVSQGLIKEVYEEIRGTENERFFPSYMKFFEEELPWTKKEARLFFQKMYESTESNPPKQTEQSTNEVFCNHLRFRYEKNSHDVLSECTCRIAKEKITCIVGANGSGKTTLLRILSGQFIPYYGKVKHMSKSVSYLPQNPDYMFLTETVEKEIHLAGEEAKQLLQRFGLEEYGKRHPLDLSGGEKQRLALCLVLSKEADCYLLDEPTKGMDGYTKHILMHMLRQKKEQGKTVIIVSHDMEFVARAADDVALMFQGNIETVQNARDFLEGNRFYTTSIHRIAKEVNEHIITEEDISLYAKKK